MTIQFEKAFYQGENLKGGVSVLSSQVSTTCRGGGGGNVGSSTRADVFS
jgi:hypothetical protein